MLCFFLIWGYVFSIDEQDKINYLKSLNIEINQDILNKKQLSRYEVIRYLNYAQCFDCIYPPKKIKEIFNLDWFENFRKQDRFYLNDIHLTDPYYYCVVSLASLDYIHWYPKTNPICGWEFCGTNNMYYWELLQVVLNIISNNIFSHYYIDNIDKFYSNLLSIKGTPIQKQVNITENEYKIAEKIKNSGEKKYNIRSFEEFYLYQKYCNIFPEDCNFKEFWKIKKWNYLLSLVNILYKENLLTLKEALNIDTQKVVSWKDLLNWLYKVKTINTCKIDNDYDKDWIKNEDDNCLYTYNPNQKDTDNDWIGDVCDPDIDNDKICNPIWIVDDLWNIIPNKIKKEDCDKCVGLVWKCDNCIFTKNPDQKDTNNNWIGDVCEKKWNDLIWIEILCAPLEGYAPLKTKCAAKTEWKVKKIIWTYNGNIVWIWNNIDYTFIKDGYHSLTATAIWENNDTATANTYFKVWKKNSNYEVGLQIKAKPSVGPVWSKIIFSKEFEWEIDSIKWNFWDGSIYTRNPKINPIKTYSKPWTYKVIAEWIKNGVVVAKSIEYVKIYKIPKKYPTSYLEAEPLKANINQAIKFSITTKNIKPEDIEKIIWNFWDNTIKTTNSLNINHYYTTKWAYPVTATIYLKNWDKINNMITVKISNNSKIEKYGASLVWTPLKQDIWKNVEFKIIPKWFTTNDIKKINWLYGDGSSYEWKELISKHKYYSNWKKHVIVNITLNTNEIITTTLTEVINGNNICQTLELAKKQLHCDMDKDWIPDMCDNDIDGDGVENFIGLILYENKNCSINENNINSERLNEEFELAKKWWNIDNCPFKSNPDQTDSNLNGIGDSCDQWLNDIDGDGITDDKDACPYIPENLNWIEDGDGCPEIETVEDNPKFLLGECNTCPCQFADYAWPFVSWTIIKAILIDPNNPNNFYNISQWVQY